MDITSIKDAIAEAKILFLFRARHWVILRRWNGVYTKYEPEDAAEELYKKLSRASIVAVYEQLMERPELTQGDAYRRLYRSLDALSHNQAVEHLIIGAIVVALAEDPSVQSVRGAQAQFDQLRAQRRQQRVHS